MRYGAIPEVVWRVNSSTGEVMIIGRIFPIQATKLDLKRRVYIMRVTGTVSGALRDLTIVLLYRRQL